MAYDPKKSPVSEKQYTQNKARSDAAIASAGPRPNTAGPKYNAWLNRAKRNFNKSAAYSQGSYDALEKLGFLGGHLLKRRAGQIGQGMSSLGKGMQGAGRKMQNMLGTGQAWRTPKIPSSGMNTNQGPMAGTGGAKPGLLSRGIKAWDNAKNRHYMDRLKNPNGLGNAGDAIFGRPNRWQGNI